jgi:hypothetical protein
LGDLRARAAQEEAGEAAGSTPTDDEKVGWHVHARLQERRHRGALTELATMVDVGLAERSTPVMLEQVTDLIAVEIGGDEAAVGFRVQQPQDVDGDDRCAE